MASYRDTELLLYLTITRTTLGIPYLPLGPRFYWWSEESSLPTTNHGYKVQRLSLSTSQVNDQEESSDHGSQRRSALDHLEPVLRTNQLKEGEYNNSAFDDEIVPDTLASPEKFPPSRDKFNRRTSSLDLSSEATILDLPPLPITKKPMSLKLGPINLPANQNSGKKSNLHQNTEESNHLLRKSL